MMKSKIWRALPLALLPLTAGACGLLDVNDPTVIEENDIANPTGANLLRAEAVTSLFNAASYGAWYSGMLADEFFAFPSANVMNGASTWALYSIDSRHLRTPDGIRLSKTVYEAWQDTRMAATHALNWYLRHGTAAERPYVGQLRAVRGHTMVALAEQVCSGFAIHEFDWDKPVFGPPLTTDQVFAKAVAELDSAVAAAADSARFLHFAKVTLGRAYLGLGEFDKAAQAVQGVPTEFVFNGEYGASPGKTNRLRFTRSTSATANNQSVADNEAGVGLDFVSANDPRVQVTALGLARDNTTMLYVATKYNSTTATMAIANGIEARLIEAEAALRNNDPSWLTILNDLRASSVAPAGLDPLVDPGTPDARVDLLFRERAFWLFGTGHRLGDLRRLVKHYGRDPESVFPSGAYHLGGVYGSDMSLSFDPKGEEQANTGVTGCID